MFEFGDKKLFLNYMLKETHGQPSEEFNFALDKQF